MTDAFQAIWQKVTTGKLPLRTAAFVLALERVTQAHIHRCVSAGVPACSLCTC